MSIKTGNSTASQASRPVRPRGGQARLAWIERALQSVIRILMGKDSGGLDHAKLLTALAVLEATSPAKSNSEEDDDAFPL